MGILIEEAKACLWKSHLRIVPMNIMNVIAQHIYLSDSEAVTYR